MIIAGRSIHWKVPFGPLGAMRGGALGLHAGSARTCRRDAFVRGVCSVVDRWDRSGQGESSDRRDVSLQNIKYVSLAQSAVLNLTIDLTDRRVTIGDIRARTGILP